MSPSKPFRILSMADIAASPNVLDPLRELGEVVQLAPSQEGLESAIPEFDAFFTPLTVQSNRTVLEKASRLRAIATASTGTDHIDVPFAVSKNIAVVSLKDDIEFLSRLTATAELAWALLLATVRRLPAAVSAAKAGNWARDGFRGRQISGKTLGIVGYGRLGKMVAEYGKAFRMRVLVCDRGPIAASEGIEQVDFERLIRVADVISIHIHLTEENRNLFSKEVFQKMKDGAVLVNTSRGAIVDESALLEALNNGKISGAGLDVIEGEWREDLADHPLIQYANAHENLIISPHIGGVTYESQALALARIVEKLADFLRTNPQST